MKNNPNCSVEIKNAMWNNIESRISGGHSQGVQFGIWSRFRPVYIGVTGVLLVALLVFILGYTKSDHNGFVMTELYSYTNYEEPNFGTAIEEFLL